MPKPKHSTLLMLATKENTCKEACNQGQQSREEAIPLIGVRMFFGLKGRGSVKKFVA